MSNSIILCNNQNNICKKTKYFNVKNIIFNVIEINYYTLI